MTNFLNNYVNQEIKINMEVPDIFPLIKKLNDYSYLIYHDKESSKVYHITLDLEDDYNI